jgi:hypothetical protein
MIKKGFFYFLLMFSFLLNKIFADKSLYTGSVYFIRKKAKNFSKLWIALRIGCITP